MARSRPCSRDGARTMSRSPPPTPSQLPLRSAMKHSRSTSSASVGGAPPTSSPLSSPIASSTAYSPSILSTSSPPPVPAVHAGAIHFADQTTGDPLPPSVPSTASASPLAPSPMSSNDNTTLVESTDPSSSRPSVQRSISSPSGTTTRRPSFPSRRISAEMPPGYSRKVGFSTLDTEEGTSGGGIGAEFSFTVQAKSSGFSSSPASRCFLVASDGASYSVSALDWLVATLVEDGDEVVVLKVLEARDCGPDREAEEDAMRREADEVLLHVLKRNDRKVQVSVEFVIGPTIKTIQKMLEVYRPDSLIVGTRGRSESAWKKAILGSTSQWLVAKSPVPVIVVRPERKVRKQIEARLANPKHRSYQALLGEGTASSSRASSTDRERGGRLSVDWGRKGSKDLRREKTSPA